ncbi:purine and uridine phosphorylase [Zopfia rhizophila CBS 207.26]|uniref:Purine and uridine phosphorylase n=1 Tax=Zopfia rhizophila CBS 207.26 TaxID=1314779 RepID=A0A6A6EA90_9PEZI|nr:purine and uridine phosphorylase [Zopfia rhizophila CBS 207.26]
MQRKLRLQDYTVGWVCALPDELAAAAELLDEEHQRHPNSLNDDNLYTLGCMNGHNVVIACLPAGRPGTSSAATVASHMKSTFTSVRFGLMVGIGGGVPSGDFDIRLGDVVISQPQLDHGGVIQYDFGKTGPSGFRRTGALNTPPAFLLSAVSTLRANHYRDQSSLLPNIAIIGRRPRFTPASAGPDILFEATYDHVGGTTCDRCDKAKAIQRKERASAEIAVHYGTIAFGNQVMKDGKTRDRLSSELGGVLCFETEAAGLMNGCPCLVIRGICDYADSHKNKTWQPYAAAAAAAYGKVLLSIIPAAEVAEQRTVLNAVDRGPDSVQLTRAELEAVLADMAREDGVNLKWRESIVDLLKLLRLASDLDARDWLAETLHIRAGPRGSPKQNIALHRAMMKELIANNGKVPKNIHEQLS